MLKDPIFEKDMRVLLLYPNHNMSFALPHSIAIISACLKKRGGIVELFDMVQPDTKNYDMIEADLG